MAWILYLFLFYCLTLAYIVGCGELVNQVFKGSLPSWLASSLFLILFAPFVYAGTRVIEKLNFFMMLGLGFFFCLFIFLGAPYVTSSLLSHRNWPLSLIGLPIAFTSFAYQGIIPTLFQAMQSDIYRMRRAILIGSFIPLIAYTIWQGLILGIVPIEGEHGLAETLKEGHSAIQPLKYFIASPFIYLVGQYFAFFALVTSFFGVTLGLVDFLADGLKMSKTHLNKLFLCALVFLPPLFVSFLYPHLFLQALDYAGGFGCALLLGLLPILMVWSGRYYLNFQAAWKFPGGKVILIVLGAFVLFELFCKVALK